MDATLNQHSIVVVGDTHNPSILNPDFLVHQNIVPKAWGWKVSETFTTPPLAVVRYQNDVAITVEPNKLQVTDGGVESDPAASKAAEVASAYVSTLPHVRYKAVGINFQSITDNPSPEELLKKRFLKPGPWWASVSTLHAAGLRLVYILSDAARVTLLIDAGEATDAHGENKRPVVVIRANIHRACNDQGTYQQVLDHLKHLQADWRVYEQLVSDTVLTER